MENEILESEEEIKLESTIAGVDFSKEFEILESITITKPL